MMAAKESEFRTDDHVHAVGLTYSKALQLTLQKHDYGKIARKVAAQIRREETARSNTRPTGSEG